MAETVLLKLHENGTGGAMQASGIGLATDYSYDYEVPYLESDGTAYIDTEYVLTFPSEKIETTYVPVATLAASSNTQWNGYFGRATGKFAGICAMVDGNYHRCAYNGIGSYYIYEKNSVPQSLNIPFQFIMQVGRTQNLPMICYRNGHEVQDSHRYARSANDYHSQGTILIFKVSENGLTARMRSYGMKITNVETGVVMRDFIPVVKNGVGYMYDRCGSICKKTNSPFYPNAAASGAFSWGVGSTEKVNATFRLVNAVTAHLYIKPDELYIGGSKAAYSYANGHITVSVPSTGTFALRATKDGYTEISQTVSAATLNGQDIPMFPVQETGNMTMALTWDHSTVLNLDTHVVINEGDTRKSEVYFGNTTYSDDKTTVKQPKDDMGGEDGDGEAATIVPVSSDYTYKLVILNYTNREETTNDALSKRSATVTFVYNGTTTTVHAPTETQGVFWYVLDVIGGAVSVVNAITTENTEGIEV